MLKISPQSQEVINYLLNRQVLDGIGQYNDNTVKLLRVIIENYDALDHKSGPEQARHIRELFTTYSINPESTETIILDNTYPTTSKWRLRSLRCCSFRGIAPYGENFEFKFDEKSHLIYGSNGSGKSSFLDAITWSLSGLVFLDSGSADKTDLDFGTSKQPWPIVVALPNSDKCKPSCFVELELRDTSSGNSLWIKREIDNSGMQCYIREKEGGKFVHCQDFSLHGISPLDIQLSVVAPAILNKRLLDDSTEAAEILYGIIGYDTLDAIGKFASKALGNCTRLISDENKQRIKINREIHTELIELSQKVHLPTTVKKILDDMVELSPTSIKIDALISKVEEETETANKKLFELLSLGDQGELPTDIYRKLITKIDYLKTLSAKEYFSQTAQYDCYKEKEVEKHIEKLKDFFIESIKQIEERYKWWLKEQGSGRRLTLLAKVKPYYKQDGKCPVCYNDLPKEIKDQFDELSKLDEKILRNVKDFFRDLTEELESFIPESIYDLERICPVESMRKEWGELKEELQPFKSAIDSVSNKMTEVIEKLDAGDFEKFNFFIREANDEFKRVGYSFVNKAYKTHVTLNTIEKLHSRFPDTWVALDAVLSSLCKSLEKGETAAQSISGLKDIEIRLENIKSKQSELDSIIFNVGTTEEIKKSLNNLGALSTYAKRKFEEICNNVENDAISFCNKLYPKFGADMMLSALKAEFIGKQKRIVPRINKGGYEFDAKYFSNTGKLRAIANSFYFALLKKQKDGLNFIVLDDPILSYDDEHRGRWTRELLVPAMKKRQVILASHQRGFIVNNEKYITDERIVELFPWNDKYKKIRFIPGHLLDQAEHQIVEEWNKAPNIMRKYAERILMHFNDYSPYPIILRNQNQQMILRNSIDEYKKLPENNPLSGSRNAKIADILLSDIVWKTMNKGSHEETSNEIKESDCKDCLKELKKCDKLFKIEINRLEKLRLHRENKIAVTTLIPFPDSANMSWNEFLIPLVGSAAAKSNGKTIDFSQVDEKQLSIPEGTAVLVTGDTLDPVARRGQWILLAPKGTKIENGDLVAVNTDENKKLLRRLWYHDAQQVLLESINPIKPIPSVICQGNTDLFRRVIGVVYEPIQFKNAENENEWSYDNRFNLDDFKRMNAVQVKGNSCEPIARNDQYALLKKEISPDEVNENANDLLAVVDTGEDDSGTVVKRVYQKGNQFILVSLNPVEPHPILVVEKRNIRKILPVMGVLFDVSNEFITTA